MHSVSAPVPKINVLPASPPGHNSEPYSPFGALSVSHGKEDDGYRPRHLTPPVASPLHSSPLRPTEARPAKGLDPEQFSALLKQSREHRTSLAGRKGSDLRRELAIKNQRNKQLERRALFLSKLREPPSPTAITLPKTPPESPVLFQCSLPSPGLASPLAAFETFDHGSEHSDDPLHARRSWVEQVDFRLPQEAAVLVPKLVPKVNKPRMPRPKGKRLPSLEEITARLNVATSERTPALVSDCPRTRLPAFLTTQLSHATETQEKATRPVTSVGRLTLPVRRSSDTDIAAPRKDAPPASPRLALSPRLQVTTVVVPRTNTFSPCPLTESNLYAFGRESMAREMISTLKRRSPSPPGNKQDTASVPIPHVTITPPTTPPLEPEHHATAAAVAGEKGVDMIKLLRRRTTSHSKNLPSLQVNTSVDERKARRRSSPAELHAKGRVGFEHPVLSIPGGF